MTPPLLLTREELCERMKVQIHVDIAMMDALTNKLLWLDSMAVNLAPTEYEIRCAESNHREVARADAEFAAAFPNWKSCS